MRDKKVNLDILQGTCTVSGYEGSSSADSVYVSINRYMIDHGQHENYQEGLLEKASYFFE